MDARRTVDLSKLRITEIRSRNCVSLFRCGEREIDRWATNKAFKFHDQDRARVFCAREDANEAVIGFYSLSLSNVGSNLLPAHGDRYVSGSAPFVYIDWFAVLRSKQSAGVGTIMMIDALKRAHRLSYDIPFYGVALRALNEKAAQFYERLGFAVRDQSTHPLMILPIWTIRDLFNPSKNQPSGSSR